MNVVIDASVSIKWFVPDDSAEEETDKAIQIFRKIQASDINPIQPVHWQAEVIAVLSRIKPKSSKQSIQLLDVLKFTVCDDVEIYQLASEMAIKLNHHMFDTLYHAVALKKQALLITSDIKYYGKAKELGSILLLGNWQ